MCSAASVHPKSKDEDARKSPQCLMLGINPNPYNSDPSIWPETRGARMQKETEGLKECGVFLLLRESSQQKIS